MALKWRDSKKMAIWWRENQENGEKDASIFLGQQDGCDVPTSLGDDVEACATVGPVTTQQTGAAFQRVFVRLFVFGTEFLSPIAAVVTAEVG
jgi:hypothetical protein